MLYVSSPSSSDPTMENNECSHFDEQKWKDTFLYCATTRKTILFLYTN